MKQPDVIIIGAGAAGLMCALSAAKRGRKVLVLEKSEKIAEKIRISGGGRCNFTNLGVTPKNYISNNPHFAVSALKRYTQHDFIALVKQHFINFHEKTLGQLFCDGSSKLIIEMLVSECEEGKVEIKTNVEIGEITKEGKFSVATNSGVIECESLVVACGGLSIPKIGATSFGYEIARKFGLSIIPTRAGLVPFTLGTDIIEQTAPLSGISVNGSAKCNGQVFKEGMIFTHRGISGPAILQISSYWKPGDEVELNLAGEIPVLEKLKEQRQLNPRQEVKTALATILPKKLAGFICGESAETLADSSNKRLEEIAAKTVAWRLKPQGTEGYRTAEVTIGGVDTDELSSKTFEAKKASGLYFIGEVVDVTGWLGGYNFQWAWSSGYCAGQYV